MADRLVTATGKDLQGDITRLCGGGQWWSPVSKQTAINEIERREHRYYTKDIYGRTANVIVVNGENGKYLRTDPDSSCANNLDNLPPC